MSWVTATLNRGGLLGLPIDSWKWLINSGQTMLLPNVGSASKYFHRKTQVSTRKYRTESPRKEESCKWHRVRTDEKPPSVIHSLHPSDYWSKEDTMERVREQMQKIRAHSNCAIQTERERWRWDFLLPMSTF